VKKIGLLFATLFLCLVLPAAAQTTQIEGAEISGADLKQFLNALHQALQPNDMTVPVVIDFKSSSEMPLYDKQAHYDGIHTTKAGTQAMYIWVNKDLKENEYNDALMGAFSLAVADGGYGGRAFKELYDVCAARDAQLPADAPDPFLNRHRLAAALVTYLNQK
jgi:hypothetical protein